MRTFNSEETSVAKVSNEEALAFIKAHSLKPIETPGKNLRTWGLYSESELLAVALFCNPRTSFMQRIYTTELFNLTFKKAVNTPQGAEKLLKAFIASKPWDVFFYKDILNEDIAFYEKMGFTDKKAENEQIVVKNGFTQLTAKLYKSDWLPIEDALIEAKETLLTLSNKDLLTKNSLLSFIKDSGYHLESVSNDIYEWRNPKIKFYTYKITSTANNGYYYGRRSFRGELCTIETCTNDGYWGSGGKLFQDWVASVGKETLHKEVLEIYSTWSEVVKAEELLINNLHLEDPDCKNFQPGGAGLGRMPHELSLRECSIHGEVLHRSVNCLKCTISKVFTSEVCVTHGLSKHRAGRCISCQPSSFAIKECPTHGKVQFIGDSCCSCASAKRLSLGECPLHGATQFQDNKCGKCTAIAQFSVKECGVHGAVAHKGDACTFCSSQKAFHTKACAIHGETIHQGTRCVRCENNSKISVRECGVHGLVKHRGETCSVCTANSHQNVRECAVHGLVKHRGASCGMCAAAKRVATLRKRKLESSK